VAEATFDVISAKYKLKLISLTHPTEKSKPEYADAVKAATPTTTETLIIMEFSLPD
jgi:hypothetical protein